MRSIILLTLLILTASLQADSITKTIKNIQDGVHFAKLDNGLRVIVYQRKAAPVFSAVTLVRVGAVDEDIKDAGISHLLEHMAFKGTKTVGTKNFARESKLLARVEEIMLDSNEGNSLSPEQKEELAKINLQLEEVWDKDGTVETIYQRLGGVDLNATTSADSTNYYVSLPNNAFDNWCEIEADRLAEPVFRQFYKERDVVQSERRMRYVDSPSGQLYRKVIHNSFEVHPYRNMTGGYKESLGHLTASKLDAFYQKYYVANNIVVTLVGDLDPQASIKKVEQCFRRFPKKNRPAEPYLVEPKLTGPKEVVVHASAQPSLAIAYPKPNYPHPDDLPLNVWLDVAIDQNSSLLHQELVLKQKVATYVSYSEAPGGRYPNLYIINAAPKSPYNNKQLLEKIDDLLEKKLKIGASQEEIDSVRLNMMTQALSGMRSNIDLAKSLGYSELIYGDWQISLKWLEELKALSPVQVNQIAKKYIHPDNRIIGRLERKR